jgi:hypothetical protein
MLVVSGRYTKLVFDDGEFFITRDTHLSRDLDEATPVCMES